MPALTYIQINNTYNFSHSFIYKKDNEGYIYIYYFGQKDNYKRLIPEDILFLEYCLSDETHTRTLEKLNEKNEDKLKSTEWLEFIYQQSHSKTDDNKAVDSKALLAKFYCVQNIVVSMILDEQEWKKNNLSQFRSSFLDTLNTYEFKFTKQWWHDAILRRYNKFASLQQNYLTPGQRAILLDSLILTLGSIIGSIPVLKVMDISSSSNIGFLIGYAVLLLAVLVIATVGILRAGKKKDADEKIAFIELSTNVNTLFSTPKINMQSDRNEAKCDFEDFKGLKSDDAGLFLENQRKQNSSSLLKLSLLWNSCKNAVLGDEAGVETPRA